MILTQNTGIIMGPVTWLLGKIFNAIYIFFNGMGVESIALSIVIFTLVMRLILFPFNLKQTKSSKIQQYLKPEFNKITKKYKGKKDQESMLAQQRETRELQEKYGIKMTQGCLTSLLQFPIFMGLYNVIQNIPSYVPKIHALYDPIVNAISKTDGAYSILTEFVNDKSNNITRVASKLTEFSASTDFSTKEGKVIIEQIIDILYKCNDNLFMKLTDLFNANPDVGTAIAQNKDAIEKVNSFIFGINLTEAPGFKLTPAIVIPIASFVCQLLAMLVMPMAETGDPQQDAQMKSMKRSMYFMPIMSFIVTVSAPAGLGIYWATSAFISFLITVFTNIYYNHVDMEKIIEKQKEKAEKATAKRKASGKKTLSERFMEAATGQAPEQEGSTGSGNKNINKYGNMNLKNYDGYNSDNTEVEETEIKKGSPKKGSLADKANAVKRFNDSGV
ncbi:YidC/Oxa1 family membrane protein insertase [Lachnospiraceae bacterium]|nr:YidC/Oxa1 family membrane protein insertase [Lachnospiraceae bacterium]